MTCIISITWDVSDIHAYIPHTKNVALRLVKSKSRDER